MVIFLLIKLKIWNINSFYNVEKLNNLFKKFRHYIIFELLTENKNLIIRGYEKTTNFRKINSFFALPFF